MNQEIIMRILEEEKYPEFMIDNTLAKIEKFTPVIKSAFIEWIEQGIVPQQVIAGYSFTQLIRERNMRPIGAFITLDWLNRDPENAKYALENGIE